MKIIFLSCLLLLRLAAGAQELLANGGFEDENICTEFIKNCAPEAWISTSQIYVYYFEGARQAYEGVHFSGVIIDNAWPRRKGEHSFLCSRLLCSLRKGHQYRVSFYIWSKHHAFDSLGVYFSAGSFLYEKRSYKQIVPQLLVHDSAGLLGGNAPWRPLYFDYTATGEENYIALGSFKKHPFRPGQTGEPDDPDKNYFLYIDNVSMQPLDPHELLCKSADSMKTAVYNENERHNLLEKKRAYYRNEPPRVFRAPPTIEQHIDTLLIPDILFTTGSAKLTPGSHQVLDSFCTALAARVSDSLVIEGHTDSVGSLQYNFRLSADRANAVEKYIRERSGGGLPKIFVRYHAYLRPLVSNASPEGRMRNRRVELFLYRHD